MITFRKVIIRAALVLIVVQLSRFDYQDYSWSVNRGIYIGIPAMVLIIVSMILANKNDRKQSEIK